MVYGILNPVLGMLVVGWGWNFLALGVWGLRHSDVWIGRSGGFRA